jgi:hypothetical protein
MTQLLDSLLFIGLMGLLYVVFLSRYGLLERLDRRAMVQREALHRGAPYGKR